MSNLTNDPGPEPPEPRALAASRPGWLTTEFALSALASLLGWLVAAGVFADGSTMAAILGAAVAVMASLGYSAARAVTKSGEAKATADAIARVAEAKSRPLDDRQRSRK